MKKLIYYYNMIFRNNDNININGILFSTFFGGHNLNWLPKPFLTLDVIKKKICLMKMNQKITTKYIPTILYIINITFIFLLILRSIY